MVMDCTSPDEIRLTLDSTLTLDNVDTAEFAQFFETIAGHIVKVEEGGHIDIFVPLCSCGKCSCHSLYFPFHLFISLEVISWCYFCIGVDWRDQRLITD